METPFERLREVAGIKASELEQIVPGMAPIETPAVADESRTKLKKAIRQMRLRRRERLVESERGPGGHTRRTKTYIGARGTRRANIC